MKLRLLFTLVLALSTIVLSLIAWRMPQGLPTMIPQSVATLTGTGAAIFGFLSATELTVMIAERCRPTPPSGTTPPAPIPFNPTTPNKKPRRRPAA